MTKSSKAGKLSMRTGARKSRISPAGKKAIADAQKARWRKWRAEQKKQNAA